MCPLPIRALAASLALALAPVSAPAAGAAGAAEPDEPPPVEAEPTEPDTDGEPAASASWDVTSPPGSWRTVTIDTEETTWTSVDVSPDGATLVFDALGDLYTVPIAGGDAAPLVTGIDWAQQPRFSPDGRQVAFVSDRSGCENLWVVPAGGGTPRAVSEETEHCVHNPAWSPEGDYLLAKKGFTSSRSIPAGEIWMFHVGGGKGVQVTERPHGKRDQKNMAGPAFSPDGRHVYFSQDTTPGRVWEYNKDATGAIFAIQRLDRESGEIETFVSGPGGAVRPTPSPDGRTLAFVKRTPAMTSALYLKDLRSGREWAVYDRLDRDLQEANGSEGNTPGFAWTPDSRSLVFWAGGKVRRVDVASREASVIPIRVRAEIAVQDALRVPVEVAPERFPVRMLRWSQLAPDGRRAVFQALGHLWAVELPDGAPRRLTRQRSHSEVWPSFSRDGRQLVYATWHDGELGSLRVLSLDTGSERTLALDPGIYVEPRFSPDGGLLVFRKLSGGYLLSGEWSADPGIYVVPVAGGEPTQLVDRGFGAHFGAAADRVYFTERNEDGELLLKSVDLAGRDERTHVQGAEVAEMAVSPDGRWLAFTEQFRAYVAPLPRSGRTVELGKDAKALPVRQVSQRAGEFLHWSADSSRIHWSHGPRLFTRELRDAFAFLEGAPAELPEPVAEGLELGFTAEADRPEGTIALVGARVVTMRDAETAREVIDDGVVVVTGDRIAAVGGRGEVAIPAGAAVVDLAGKTVLPGLVDVHAHGALGQVEILPQQNWMQLSNLAFGVTTLHDPSNDTSEIFAAAELQRTGALLAPRIFSTGTILYGAHLPGFTAEIATLDDARFHVGRLAEVGAISVKSYNQPRRDQRQMVLAAARELGMMVVPEGGSKINQNLTMVVDGHTGIEHAVPLAGLYDDVLQLWAATAVGYTPTLGVAYGGLMGEEYWYGATEVWRNERLLRWTPRFVVEPRSMRRRVAPFEHYNHVRVAASAKALRDRGVPVQIGAHGQREGLAAHWELWMLEQGGFTPWEALRAGTIDGARYLGLDGDIGSLEPGKLADLFVVYGDPLADLSRSEWVAYTMLGGRLYEAATLAQVLPERQEREELFFRREGGDTLHPATQRWLEDWHDRYGCRH